jgi:hypothetical protein
LQSFEVLIKNILHFQHQRAAWKAQELPHKPVCKLIQALRRAIHMDDNVAWTRLIHDTESGRAVGHFLALCAQYQVDPALGHAFLVATGRLG